MPKLKILGRTHNPWYEGQYYKNEDAIEKVIRYITRTRPMEDRSGELISCGGSGVTFRYGVEFVIRQMQTTQDFYRIDDRGGRRLGHEVFCFDDEDFELVLDSDYRAVERIAQEVCDYYFRKGFEAVFANHFDEAKHMHTHIAYNYVSYIDGHKYRSLREDIIEKHTVYLNAYWRAYIRANERRMQLNRGIVPIITNLGNYWKFMDTGVVYKSGITHVNNNLKEERKVC